MWNSVWIFDLFPKKDFNGMISNVRGEARGFGVPDNLESITNFFFDKIRCKIKVVLCHSPVGDFMRIRSRKFPGIINSTSIDWFHPWPADALIGVSQKFLLDVEFPDETIRNNISLMMSNFHISIDEAANIRLFLKLERRHNYTTLKSYLELIEFYKKI